MFKALRIAAIAATLTAGAAHASINPHPDFGTSAPEAAGVDTGVVTVYVASNPLYRG